MPSRTEIEALAETVRLKKRLVLEARCGHTIGSVTYDELAQAGRDLSAALYAYSRAKYPHLKIRRQPYQALIR